MNKVLYHNLSKKEQIGEVVVPMGKDRARIPASSILINKILLSLNNFRKLKCKR